MVTPLSRDRERQSLVLEHRKWENSDIIPVTPYSACQHEWYTPEFWVNSMFMAIEAVKNTATTGRVMKLLTGLSELRLGRTIEDTAVLGLNRLNVGSEEAERKRGDRMSNLGLVAPRRYRHLTTPENLFL